MGLALAAALPLAACEALLDTGRDPVPDLTRRVDALEATVARLQRQASLGAGSGATAPPPGPPPAAPAAAAPGAGDPIAEAAGPPRYAIHLASYRRPADVGRGWRTLTAGYPRLLAGLQPRVAAVDFGDRRGTFYRLKAGPYDTRQEAAAACRRLRGAGLYCAVEDFMGTPGEAFWRGL
jgi:hypothetical protein